MWFYNNAMGKWFHSSGVVSTSPADRMPTQDDLMLLLAQKEAIKDARRLEPPLPAKKPNDCGCNKGGNRAAR